MRVRWNRRHVLKGAMLASLGWVSGLVRLPASAFASEPVKGTSWTTFRNSPENWGIAQTVLSEKLTRKWERKTSDGTASTPVIADGHVYVGTLSGDLLCLRLTDGEEVWKYRSQEVVEPNNFAPGFNAAAALNETSVFIGDDQGGFHAVDRSTGKRRWHVMTNGEIVGGAQFYKNQVIFGSHDGHLYSHDAQTGTRVWSVETHGPVNATPCLSGNHTFITGCDQPILRVIDVEKGEQAAEVPLDSLLLATAAARDDILYFGTDNGAIIAMNWKKKETIWEFSSSGKEQQVHSSPAVTEDFVVIGSRDKKVYCLNRKNGELVWSFTCRAKIDSSPVIVGDRVFFGASDKNLYGVRLSDGKEVFKEFVRNAVTGSPAIADGHLVIGCESTNGLIICFA